MNRDQNQWINQINQANAAFLERINQSALPVDRAPGRRAVITCMDPRVNLEAIGLPQFGPDGSGDSSIRVIRTIGGLAERRSLVVGLFLAGIREIAVVMHTDCGNSLAYSKIDLIVANMEKSVESDRLARFKAEIGQPFAEKLRDWLGAFADPYEAVKKEAAAIKALPFAPADLIVHGLVYDLATGAVETVVNGYEGRV